MSENNKKETKEKKEEDKKKKSEVRISTIVYGAVVVVLAFLVFTGALVYGFGINNAFTRKVEKIIPFPAALWSFDGITLSELSDKTESVRKFYENQDFSDLGVRVDFNTEDGKKRLKIKEKAVLNKIIEDRIIEKEAKKRGIFITDELVSQEVDRKLNEYGSENYLKENMDRLYGWSIDDFKKNIVKPDIYREKLFESIRENDPDLKKSQEKITKVLEELDSKKDFQAVAEKYSEGESAKNGGDLGWFGAEQMLPEISEVAFSLEKGKTSKIIESSIGYHIIKINDKKTQEDKEMVKVSQIFVRSVSFGDWLAQQEKGMRIFVPAKYYYWDKNTLQVEFNDADLKSFEENLEKNSPDDISVMF